MAILIMITSSFISLMSLIYPVFPPSLNSSSLNLEGLISWYFFRDMTSFFLCSLFFNSPFNTLIMLLFQVNNAAVSGAIVDFDALRTKLPDIIAAEASCLNSSQLFISN